VNLPNLPGEHRSRRTFSEPPKRAGLRDTDVGERGILLNAALAGIPGAFLGAALGYFLVARGGSGWLFPLCVVLGAALVGGGTLLLTLGAGSVASRMSAPSSGATPRPKEHSRAEALVAGGSYEDAVAAFELAVLEDPSDPTPYLRIARIYRDHLGKPEDAVRWFRRALRESQPTRGTAVLARKELIELFSHRMGAPERALPELARMAEELAGSPEGEWAAAELRDIKARLSEGAG